MLKINLEYLPSINYALTNNHIAVCQSLSLTNVGDDDVRDIEVECSGEFFEVCRTRVSDVIRTGQTVRVSDIRLTPIPRMVAAVTEKTLTTFSITVTSGHASADRCVMANEVKEIEIMPYDQWLGTSILPQCLASFVMPNSQAIDRVVVKAAARLKDMSHASALTAYQTGNANEVRRQVAAVFGALHDEGIVYRQAPASYETVGQRITLPDQVLSGRLGNCIELTLLFASILESIGINSCVILQKGHAYLAVWLVDDCCRYSVCDDASYIEKKCAEGIGEMMVLECTAVTAEHASFEDAQRMAEKNLADTTLFEMLIDIRRCRLEQVRPLPQLAMHNGTWQVEANGVTHDECLTDVKEHSRYDLSKIMDSKHEVTKMDIWERKLLDFSLRNSMLNLYLRQKAIQFISFDINLIEDRLQDGQEYVITHKPDIDIRIEGEERLVRSKTLPELHELITNDIQHHTLHTYQTESETHNTLKNIYRASRNAIEETGANALYLAIGTLRWYETELSEKPRYAPILMLPVEMVYKKGDYHIRTRDEDIALNITLFEFLRQNYDIQFPGLNPLPKDEHGADVQKIFAIIREVLKNKKRWDVEEEAILGVFSFSKFLMWNDIHNHREQLLQNDVIRSLVQQRLVFTPDQVTADMKGYDKTVRPDALALPVPIDSSQMAAVMEAGKGHSFILYGPPGTGKSQTITNLIANALFQGKRVLFVAEKMAALSVVQKRLEKINLGPFCLEMHSNKITKRHVLEQLKKALGVAHIVRPEEYARIAEQLYNQRSRLIEYMEALHDVKGPEGMSLYDCIVRYEAIQAPEMDIDTADDDLKRLFSIEHIDHYNHLLSQQYQAVTNLIGHPSAHPLAGLTVTEADLCDATHLTSRLNAAADVVSSASKNHARLSRAEGTKAEILKHCNSDILNEDASALYNEWREVKAKWFLPRFFAKRSFIGKMRQYDRLIAEQDIDTLIAKLTDYQQMHHEIAGIQATISQYFGVEPVGDTLPTPEHLDAFVQKLRSWQSHTSQARDWYQWCAYSQQLRDAGLRVLARKIEQEPIPAQTLCNSFLKTVFHSIANEKIAQSSVLRTFEGSIFDETVTRYHQLTEEFQLLSQKELYARLASSIPHVTDSIDNSSEIGLLNRNISNGGRGLSLRDLLDQIPTLLPRLCPCMLMSPMSVAQFLDLSQEKFDLVIFDEASQMPTSEAVGAIARGKSVIVVGDPKQMPPTSFFSSTSVNEDEADIDDMESILEDCRTLDLPSLQLTWHYRSRHESLIAFSNNEYYDGQLITFPSVDDQATRVSYHFVDGVYDKGGRRSNRKEAEAIVSEIARRLAAPGHATCSIGVIAFSVVQQCLIEDLLIELLDNNRELHDAAEEMYEPIFVKNLENVQGDERDIILFSIGYGPDKEGKVSMNFGPLNNAGGERRLNVAVSRARREMMVFTSLKASQIDLRRSKARGVAGLKHFLEYAEQQILPQSAHIAQDNSDTVIADQIATALRSRGHIVSTSIGRSGFKVDIAIADKNNETDYALGILLDGRGYHDTQTTRDREIVQPDVLRTLGWKIMRLWSVDWLTAPDRVISRIETCLNKREHTPAQQPAYATATFDVSQEKMVTITSAQRDYCAYEPNSRTATMSDQTLALAILTAEQPMTPMYLCRRMCSIRGAARVTPTLISTVNTIAAKKMHIQQIGTSTILWTDRETAQQFKEYRQHNGRDITDIPLIEVMNAVTDSIRQQLSIRTDALTLIVAKQMGFTRRGAKVDQALNTALEILLADNRIIETDGMLRLATPNA